MDIEEDDIGADIRAALAETRANMPETPAPVVETPIEAAPEPEQTQQPAQANDGRERDEHGRFKPKTEAPQQSEARPGSKIPAPQQSAEAEGEKPLVPPRNWEPEAKAQFMAAPPAIQKQMLAMAEATAKGEEEWRPRAQTWEQIEQVIAPVRDQWAMRGLSDAQGISMLVAAQRVLDQNPAQGLAQIAQSYGLNLNTLLQEWGVDLSGMQHQPQNPGPEIQQYLRPILSEVEALRSAQAQREQAEEASRLQSLQAEIDSFASDPKHVYFENVKPQMIALLQTKQATDLATAYEMATWARPDIRKLIMAQDSAAAAKAESERIAKAKRAGMSVTGDPGAGRASSAPPVTSSNNRDEIAGDVRSALRELRANI